MIKENRIEWIDVARGSGIFLVVLGHVWRGIEAAGIIPHSQLYFAVDNAIYLFHMPLFFLLSGMLFEHSARRGSFSSGMMKRLESLIYPLILWSYITAVFLLLAGSVTNRSQISLFDAITYPFPPKDIYWFLAALFVSQTIGWIFVKGNSKLLYVLAFVSASAAVLLLDLASLSIWTRNTIENLPYFFLGLMLVGGIPRSPRAATLGAFAFMCVETWAVTRGELLRTPLDFVPGIIATLSFVVMVAWFVDVPGTISKAAAYLGRASMTIYVSHIIALAAIRIALVKAGISSAPIHVIIGVTAGIALPLVFHYFAARFGLMRLFGLGKDTKAFLGTKVLSANRPSS
jgi:fucose 4-O-acetylase-like acetyltransferase